MKRFGRLRPSPAMVVAMVALSVALGGTSYAVISSSTVPDSLGVFHACVNRSSGGIRIVTNPSSCHKAVAHGKHKTLGELPVAWSQTGPAGNNGTNGSKGTNGANGTNGADGSKGTNGANGTNGTNGADGTNGTNGADGSPGISGYQLVWGSNVSNPHGQQTLASAFCPAGMKVIGGGGGGTSTLPDQSINSSFARGDGTGWNVEENNSSVSKEYEAYAVAVCAKVAG